MEASDPGRSSLCVVTSTGLMANRVLVISNGRVIDPANGIDGVRHVVVRGGIIEAVAEEMPEFSANEHVTVYDASNQLVCPGLVDLHAHLYTHATPLGIDVDHYCVGRGVTTAVDAGSAGATTLPGLREFIAKRSKTRVLAFVNIALHGLAAAGCTGSGTGGELDSLNQCSVDHCVDAVCGNRDIVVGIKIRLSEDAADNGKNEAEAFRRALLAAKRANVPLMTHHTFSEVPLGQQERPISITDGFSREGANNFDQQSLTSKAAENTSVKSLGCPGSLKTGDIYTHTFHGFASTIIDVGNGRMVVHPAVLAARKRGVVFDVGHGQGSFNWTVASRRFCSGSI